MQRLTQILKSKIAQNMVEYLIVFTSILVVLILALGPSGVITLQTDESIELAVNAIHVMAECICYDVDGNPCPPVNNDGCCYPGTAPGTDNDCEPALTSPCDNDGFCEDGESCTCPDCFPCSTCAWTPWTPQTLCNAPCGGTGTFTEARSCSCGPPTACPPDADGQAVSRIQPCTSSCVCTCSWSDACGTPPCCGIGSCPPNQKGETYICNDISCANHGDNRCTVDPCCDPYTDGGCYGTFGSLTCPEFTRLMLPPVGCSSAAYCNPDPTCGYSCTPLGTSFPNPPYHGVCAGDEAGLTVPTQYHTVPMGSCTVGRKCEVECEPPRVPTSALSCALCPPSQFWDGDCAAGFCEQGSCSATECWDGLP